MKVTMMKNGLLVATFATILAGMSVGCGYSEEEYQAQVHARERAEADLKASQKQIVDDKKRFDDSMSAQDKLKSDLKKLGVDLDAAKTNAESLERALKEYKEKADTLEAIEKRFRELKARLDKLNSIGLKVVVRNNRMVIQLPGDVLFDSGKDELKESGKEVLLQVADVIKGDSTLATRDFQVAGHTDNAKYPPSGQFKDNWGLSLARSRQVLLFLTGAPGDRASKDPKKRGGGALDTKHWSASGFGDTDPQAGSVEHQTTEEQGHNRRVELVLQPNVEEMLNISKLQ
ncbi:MAG TPA: OmpA family protein [Polyangiaceae bacterium]|nr:OmpA family protein [Polyangiaceae bacterium]